VIVLFQITLILGGNLSFLNYLTIVPALACFDDSFWARLFPGSVADRAERSRAAAAPSRPMNAAAWALAAVVFILSVRPAVNLFSPNQMMNASFDPLDLVNTYGAFGSIGRVRGNIVFEGTDAASPDAETGWKPYPYKGLPTDPAVRPPQIAPYQLRLDWQMWFASMSSPQDYPWTVHLVWKLLHDDPGAVSLFASNPFPGRPPRYVRAVYYTYAFADPDKVQGAWWTRKRIGLWIKPLGVESPELHRFLEAYGWLPSSGRP
jgi:hypothetical protein